MRQLVSSAWHSTVKRYGLRPGSVTEWCVGQIMELLIQMTESSRQTVYRQQTTVKKIEERTRTVWAGGHGKDAKTKEVFDGWWVTFRDSLTAVRCETKPDCQVGDIAINTWEFRKP